MGLLTLFGQLLQMKRSHRGFIVKDLDYEHDILKRTTPSSEKCITLPDLVFDCKFHPNGSLVASGLITGDIVWYGILTSRRSCLLDSHRFDEGFSTFDEAFQVNAHRQSCRALDFSLDGAC